MSDDFGVRYQAPHVISEWSDEHQSPQPYPVGASFSLPHQCDEWVIGDGDDAVEQMRAFIAECQAVLDAALADPDHDAPTDTPMVTP